MVKTSSANLPYTPRFVKSVELFHCFVTWGDDDMVALGVGK